MENNKFSKNNKAVLANKGKQKVADNDDFNKQPVNNIVGENKIKLSESELYQVIKESVKRVLSEVDFRTLISAADKADKQAKNQDNPTGFRQKRVQQAATFHGGVRPQIKKDYGLTDDQINDAYKGNGDSYSSASRRQLKNMDKLANDYNRFERGESKYENGKWG